MNFDVNRELLTFVAEKWDKDILIWQVKMSADNEEEFNSLLYRILPICQ